MSLHPQPGSILSVLHWGLLAWRLNEGLRLLLIFKEANAIWQVDSYFIKMRQVTNKFSCPAEKALPKASHEVGNLIVSLRAPWFRVVEGNEKGKGQGTQCRDLGI